MITKNSNIFKYRVKQIALQLHLWTLTDNFTITGICKEYSITVLIIDSVCSYSFYQPVADPGFPRGWGVNHKGGFTSSENWCLIFACMFEALISLYSHALFELSLNGLTEFILVFL